MPRGLIVALLLALAGAPLWAQTSYVLQVQGSPTNYGAPTPYGYGSWTNIADDTWITNNVASPTNFSSTGRRACLGWTAAYTNVGWTITNTSTQAVFQLTNHVVLTWFWTNEYYLATTAATNGSLVTNLTGWYTSGTQVVVAATGNTGYAFSQWTGDVPSGGHTNNPLTVTMDQARTIQANFASLTPQTKTWSGTNNWTNATSWSPAGMPWAQDTVVIPAGSVTLRDPTWIASLAISNATLSFQSWSNYLTASNIVINNGGVIKHDANTDTAAPWVPNAGVFIRCTNLTVNSGGKINADYVGYQGGYINYGYGPGGGRTNFETWDVIGSGAGHAYNGGWSDVGPGGSQYGDWTNVFQPGSGGGSGGYDSYGGHGGGYIQVLASGTLTVGGSISADGLRGMTGVTWAGRQGPGGGSGGGIYLECDTITGNGSLYARGGYGTDGSGNGGGGSGGRIYLSANQATGFTCTISTKAGAGFLGASPYEYDETKYSMEGTVYLSKWDLLPPTLSGGGAARFYAPTGSAPSLTITNYTFTTYESWETVVRVAGDLKVLNAGIIQSYLYNWDSASPWTPTAGVFLECGNLTIESGGQINVDKRGYHAYIYGCTNGYGPGGGKYTTSFDMYGTCGGGGYGGAGGNGNGSGANGGAAYDTSSMPTNPGSAGGGGSYWFGGHGGGYVRVIANNQITINGLITANGGIPRVWNYWTGRGGHGGGSGGGIYLRCQHYAGSGTLRANGANGANANGGGGGGGRIAIYILSAPFYRVTLPSNSVSFGTGYNPGNPGTVYLNLSKPRGTILSTW